MNPVVIKGAPLHLREEPSSDVQIAWQDIASAFAIALFVGGVAALFSGVIA